MCQQQSSIMRKYICLLPRERKKLANSLNSVPITEILSWSVSYWSASKKGKINRTKTRSKPQVISLWKCSFYHGQSTPRKGWSNRDTACCRAEVTETYWYSSNTEKQMSRSHYKPIFLIWFHFKPFRSCRPEAHNASWQGSLSFSLAPVIRADSVRSQVL